MNLWEYLQFGSSWLKNAGYKLHLLLFQLTLRFRISFKKKAKVKKRCAVLQSVLDGKGQLFAATLVVQSRPENTQIVEMISSASYPTWRLETLFAKRQMREGIVSLSRQCWASWKMLIVCWIRWKIYFFLNKGGLFDTFDLKNIYLTKV